MLFAGTPMIRCGSVGGLAFRSAAEGDEAGLWDQLEARHGWGASRRPGADAAAFTVFLTLLRGLPRPPWGRPEADATVGQSVATWLGVLHSLAHSSPTMMLCKPSSRYTVPPEIRPDDHQIDHASLAERAPVGTLPEAMDRRIPMSGPPPAWDGSARPADVVVGRGRR